MLNPRNSNSFVLIFVFFTATYAVSRLAARTKDNKLVYTLELNLLSPRETSGVLMAPTSRHQLSLYSCTIGTQKIDASLLTAVGIVSPIFWLTAKSNLQKRSFKRLPGNSRCDTSGSTQTSMSQPQSFAFVRIKTRT